MEPGFSTLLLSIPTSRERRNRVSAGNVPERLRRRQLRLMRQLLPTAPNLSQVPERIENPVGRLMNAEPIPMPLRIYR